MSSLSIQSNLKSYMLFSDGPVEKINKSLLQERDSSETFEATEIEVLVSPKKFTAEL